MHILLQCCSKENQFLDNYTAQSLNNWIFLLFKYEPLVVFSFDILSNVLRNPEQRKLEFFSTALLLNLCASKFPKFILSHLVQHMKFKAEFVQVCFRCSADFIQPSFHLFCDVVIIITFIYTAQITCNKLIGISRALLSLFFDLHCGFTSLYDLHYLMHMPV